jgi:hypothetical protein
MNQFKPWEYVLEDFLELKASLSTRRTTEIKNFLFSEKAGGVILALVEGLRLGKHLVVVEAHNSTCVEDIIFVKPGNGQIQIRRLH